MGKLTIDNFNFLFLIIINPVYKLNLLSCPGLRNFEPNFDRIECFIEYSKEYYGLTFSNSHNFKNISKSKPWVYSFNYC